MKVKKPGDEKWHVGKEYRLRLNGLKSFSCHHVIPSSVKQTDNNNYVLEQILKLKCLKRQKAPKTMSCPYQNLHVYKLLISVFKIKYILERSSLEPNL